MEEKYNGEERRTDNTSVRLALLERSYFENRDSMISVHKRITDFKSEVKEDMRTGFEDLKNEIKESAKGCVVCKKETNDKFQAVNGRVSCLENWRNWLTGAWVATSILVGAVFSHFMWWRENK